MLIFKAFLKLVDKNKVNPRDTFSFLLCPKQRFMSVLVNCRTQDKEAAITCK